MKTQKLSLNDFEAVGTAELLEVKGGAAHQGQIFGYGRGTGSAENSGPGGGCKEGDKDPFGGTYSMNEVVVTNGPMFQEQTGSWVHQPCQGCSELESPRSTFTPLGRTVMDASGIYHNPGCGGSTNSANRHKVWQPFNEQ